MPDILVCIACLSTDNRMCFIGGTQLPEIYEKLTLTRLSEEDRIPKTVCYICYRQLQRCCRFMNMATRAGQTLTKLLSDGFQITKETISAIDNISPNNLVATVLKTSSYLPSTRKVFDNIPSSNHFMEDAEITISLKEERYNDEQINIEEELITIKEEPIEVEMGPTTELKCTPENEQTSQKVKKVIKELKAAAIHQLEDSGSRVPEADTQGNDLLKPQTKYKKKYYKRSDKKSHACNSCDMKFSCQAYLLRHSRVHTGEKPFLCKTCSKTFAQKSHLIQHMRLHTGEQPYTCHICKNKAFNHRYNYKTHMRKHFGVPTNICDLCQSAFHQKADLKRHLMSHTGEKPYTCNICDMKFSQNCHLTKHRQLHDTKKPYSCNTCKLDFAQKTNLNKHYTMHLEKKPFACHFQGCSKSYKGKSTLANHLKTHQEERPYKCDKCDKTFQRKGHLVKHISKIHENTQNNQTDLQTKQNEPILCQREINLQDQGTRGINHFSEHIEEYIIP